MATVPEVNDDSFAAEVLGAAGPVLVEVGAPWCPPCRALEPHVEAVAQEYAGRLKVVALDSERAPRAAESLRVRAVPTLVLLRDGRELARQVGAVSRAKLVALFAPHL